MTKESFADIILKNEETFYRVSKSILRSDTDCEDAIHNAVLKAFENLGRLKREEFFKTWFTRILINECLKIRKENSRYAPESDTLEALPSGQDGSEDYSELYSAISVLPEKLRITVVLFYIEGFRIEEISEILKIPKGTVKSRLNTGRKRLKELLEDVYEF
ncbi:MAG: sigma-70 family RNA polymerase sigma factor [Clostridia bacterium]|nr:sigma-70 family RNA polymerase sigma factor [Clostridia bacterium]